MIGALRTDIVSYGPKGVKLKFAIYLSNCLTLLSSYANMIQRLFFAILGTFALKRQQSAFIAGMALYAVDAMIFLAVQEFLKLGFHVIALYGLWGGLRACRKLGQRGETAISAT